MTRLDNIAKQPAILWGPSMALYLSAAGDSISNAIIGPFLPTMLMENFHVDVCDHIFSLFIFLFSFSTKRNSEHRYLFDVYYGLLIFYLSLSILFFFLIELLIADYHQLYILCFFQ